MTNTPHSDLKVGDRVRFMREGTVTEIRYDKIKVNGQFGPFGGSGTITLRTDSTEFLLLERPVPVEPAIGYIVVDRSGEVWQRRNMAGSQAWAGLHSRYTTWAKLNAHHGPLEILPRVTA